MSGSALFRTTAIGRQELIEASQAMREVLAAKRQKWRDSTAPTVPAALDGDSKDNDMAEALEDEPPAALRT